MKKEVRHSYGVIPLTKKEGTVRVLLIKQKHPEIEYWTFPKGTPEGEETPLETAIRETKEETGITCDYVDEAFTLENQFTFVDGDIEYDKTVTYFLGRVTDTSSCPQETEVDECKWMTLDEAYDLLTFPAARHTIDEIKAYLSSSRLFSAE